MSNSKMLKALSLGVVLLAGSSVVSTVDAAVSTPGNMTMSKRVAGFVPGSKTRAEKKLAAEKKRGAIADIDNERRALRAGRQGSK